MTLVFSLNGAELSLNSKSHWIQRVWEITEAWIRLNIRIYSVYMCLCGTVVSSLCLTQEIVGSNIAILFSIQFAIFCHWILFGGLCNCNRPDYLHSQPACHTPVNDAITKRKLYKLPSYAPIVISDDQICRYFKIIEFFTTGKSDRSVRSDRNKMQWSKLC